MALRVTPNVFLAQAIRAAQQHGTRLADLQAQASSGLKLTRPSDDPAGTGTLLAVRSTLGRMDTELENVAAARARLNQSFTLLQDAQHVLSRARVIALQGQQSVESAELQPLAQEVDSLLGRLLAIANTGNNGEYLFGGDASATQPFVQNSGDGRITYVGSSNRAATDVAATLSIDALYTGSDVFQPRERGPSLYLGQTGAAPGPGVDSGTGRAELLVTHVATSYAPGSGVAPGASSAAGDTIIGLAGAHLLTIVDTSGTGAFGTVSLDGGFAVAFTSADSDLAVAGPDGDVVSIDTTAITAGFSGDVSITADGALSTDGGLSQVAIDFSTNQVVVNSQTGAVTNVDGSGIRRTGAEPIEYAGTADAFQALSDLYDNLLNTRQLGEDARHEAIARSIADLHRLHEHLLDVVGEQSVSLETLDTLEARVQDLRLEQQRVASNVESADLADVILRLQQEQSLLSFTLAGTARLFEQSLVDFL